MAAAVRRSILGDAARLAAATEVQRDLRLLARPARVPPTELERFTREGYKSVDQTQVQNSIHSFSSYCIGGSRW